MARMKTAPLACGALAAILSSAAVPSDDLERATALTHEMRYPEAREVLAPLLAREPGNPRARLLHGILHAHEGRLREAVEVFTALKRDHPDVPEPYNNLAVLYAAQGRYEDAREMLLAVIERHPEFAAAWANLGDVYMNLAHGAWRRARNLGSGHGPGAEQGEELRAGAAPSDAPSGSPAAGAQAAARAGAGGGRPAAARRLKLETAVTGAETVTEAEKEAPPTRSEAAPPPAIFCLRAKGYRERRDAEGAAEWLRARGLDVEVRLEERRAVASHQVYLPPFASREEAAAKLRELRARGVRDIAVIRRGELKNGISLGVYRLEANMRWRVDALERLGYPVRHAPNVRTLPEYVVEARARRGANVPSTLEADWAARFPERPPTPVDCG